MRRMCFGVAVTLTLAVAAFGQSRTDKESKGLKGPVKTVRDEKVVITRKDGKQVVGPKMLDSEETFNEQGSLVVRALYKPDGTIMRQTVYASKGPGEKTMTDYGPDGKLMHEINYKEESGKAGAPGRLLVTGMGGDLHNEVVTKYDSQGRVTEQLTYDREGALTGRNLRKYEEGDAPVEFLAYNAAGLLFRRYIYKGDATEVFIYDNDGSVRMTLTHRQPVDSDPDSCGNWTKRVWTWMENKPGGAVEVTEITYRTITYF